MGGGRLAQVFERASEPRVSWPHPRRLYALELPSTHAELELPEESRRHAQVLRLREGTDVELFDANGNTARAALSLVSPKHVRCTVEPREHVARATPSLQLVLGLPKADKLDNVVRMLTELGVAAIHVAITERAVPKPSDKPARQERLERIAREACAQSGQPYAPELHAPAPLAEVAARAPSDATRWVLWEESSGARPGTSAPPQSMWVVVGPEGGLAAAEVDGLCARGFVQVGLGDAVLRFETAAVTAAVLALERLGRLRG